MANNPHDPIAIDGDANFSATALAEDWPGDGSAQNPYIIENYDITLGPTPEATIKITNTRVNYSIRGCNLIGPAATPSYGVFLENSSNGRIVNNMITNFAHGLNISMGCTNLTVGGNNISYNSYGIWLDDSDNFTITQNHCSHNIFTGIYVSHSDYGIISGNNCSGNGEHGIQMIYLSRYLILTDNTCNENAQAGFRLQGPLETILENNTSNENEYGIRTIASEYNYIQWNIFANNTYNVVTDGLVSVWDYNYWSDYTGTDANSDGIGDTPYNFGYVDNYPLMFPPFPVEWVEPISDQYVEFGAPFVYSIAVYCPAPYVVWMNDSTDFYLDNEVIYSRVMLPIGDYPLRANATNIYGYRTDATFRVLVRDTTPPTITHPDDISFRVDDMTTHEIQWTASDLSPLSYTILRNGTELTSSPTTSTSWFLSITIEDLPPGEYNYTVVAVDTSGNVAYDVVLVTILPIPFMEAMLPWLIIGAVGIVAVIVLVIAVRKWRK